MTDQNITKLSCKQYGKVENFKTCILHSKLISLIQPRWFSHKEREQELESSSTGSAVHAL